VLPVHYRPPEMLPPHQRDFPPRERAPDHLHVRDTRFLLLMVFGYLVAMLGGIVLLTALSPITHVTTHPTDTADVKASGR
jgi:hypothetical protein